MLVLHDQGQPTDNLPLAVGLHDLENMQLPVRAMVVLVTVIVNKAAVESSIRRPLIWVSVVAVGMALAGFLAGKWLGRVEELS